MLMGRTHSHTHTHAYTHTHPHTHTHTHTISLFPFSLTQVFWVHDSADDSAVVLNGRAPSARLRNPLGLCWIHHSLLFVSGSLCCDQTKFFFLIYPFFFWPSI